MARLRVVDELLVDDWVVDDCVRVPLWMSVLPLAAADAVVLVGTAVAMLATTCAAAGADALVAVEATVVADNC